MTDEHHFRSFDETMTTDQRIAVLLAEIQSLRDEVASMRKRTSVAVMWDWILRASVPVTLALIAQALLLWRDVGMMQAREFDRDDAALLEATMRRDGEPPEWLREDLREIKQAVGGLDALAVQVAGLAEQARQNANDIKALEEKR